MRPAESILNSWLPAVVFAAWMLALVLLLASGRYLAFLRPEFGWLLVLAHFIALGFMIAAMAANRRNRTPLAKLGPMLVLLIPILYLMGIPDAMLGGNDFKMRFVGTGSLASVPAEPAREPFPWEREEVGALPPEESGVEEQPGACTLTDLYRQPQRYAGRPVTVVGMVMHDEQLGDHFAGRQTVIYRFLINCCAADALPLAVAIEPSAGMALANDQWVRVSGIFSLESDSQRQVPVILEAELTAIKAPGLPYLF